MYGQVILFTSEADEEFESRAKRLFNALFDATGKYVDFHVIADSANIRSSLYYQFENPEGRLRSATYASPDAIAEFIEYPLSAAKTLEDLKWLDSESEIFSDEYVLV
jgi:hypothetical protein